MLTPYGWPILNARRWANPESTVGASSNWTNKDGAELQQAAKEYGLGRYRCATLLHPAEYQLLMVDAPNVPREELKAAIRWRVKDLLDYHIDDATMDVLDIPVEKDAPAKSHYMYAVAAKNEIVQRQIAQFERADIALQVIDIPETAQRNIAATLRNRPTRHRHADLRQRRRSVFTLSFEGELYLARRLDLTWPQLAAARGKPEAGLFRAHRRRAAALARSLRAPVPAHHPVGTAARADARRHRAAGIPRFAAVPAATADRSWPTRWNLRVTGSVRTSNGSFCMCWAQRCASRRAPYEPADQSVQPDLPQAEEDFLRCEHAGCAGRAAGRRRAVLWLRQYRDLEPRPPVGGDGKAVLPGERARLAQTSVRYAPKKVDVASRRR